MVSGGDSVCGVFLCIQCTTQSFMDSGIRIQNHLATFIRSLEFHDSAAAVQQ